MSSPSTNPDELALMEPGRRGIWHRLTGPPDFIEGYGARLRARLLSSLLVVLLLLAIIGFIFTFLAGSPSGQAGTIAQAGTAVVLGIAYGLSRTKYHYLAAGLIIAMLALLPFVALLPQEAYGADNLISSMIWMVLPVLLSSVLMPIWATSAVAGIIVVGLALLPVLVPAVSLMDVVMPVGYMAVISGLVLVANRYRDLVERDRQKELLESNLEMQAIRASLEQRVADRTQELERRALRSQAAAEVARDAAAARDLRDLLERAVNLIHERFEFYHAGIFLVDEQGEYAVLQAATGEAGRQMLEAGHRLAVGEVGIVGYVTGRGEPRIALDVGTDAVHFNNPYLPETRSEMALPLWVGGRVIGALDVQSREAEAFGEGDVAMLQTMADQLAVAIQNARLLSETQETMRELETASERVTHELWKGLTRESERPRGYRYRRLGVEPLAEQPAEVRQVLSEGRSVVANVESEVSGSGRSTLTVLSVPLRLRDQVLGVLNLRFESETISPDTVSLVEEAANRLALALENARLLERARQRALWEQTLSSVTDQIRAEAEIDAILERSLEELGRVLGAERAFVQLSAAPAISGSKAMREVQG